MKNVNVKNIGKKITTHAELENLVKKKKWIVEKVKSTNKVNTYEYKVFVAAWFVNTGYMNLCRKLRNGKLFEYKKNK